MKNILLASVLITISSLTVAQNVNIPDPNFKAYLIGNSFINLNGDTEIQISEATAFNGGIACNWMNISDLTGIEAFTSLTWLECYENQLTSLDVSQNTSLTYLRCQSNQLTNLNVNGAIALTELNCNYNQLTSLDVSGATAMIDLQCYNNQLLNLNLNQCTNLIALNCFENQLSSLDVSENIHLISLHCGNNLLTNLNVSQNIELYGLNCPSNQLTILDISQNTELVVLVCEQNSLTSLDVSQNASLNFLNCRNNQLNVLNFTQNSDLINLYCQDNQLNSLDLRNGNNFNMLNLYTTNNSSLFCIQVDDSSYSNANWNNVDSWSSFSTNCNYASIVEIKMSNVVSVFPNPTINTINLEADESLIGSFYSIYDTMGKLMLNGKITSENTTVDLSEISQGIYSLRVGLNLEQTVKVVKE